MEFRILKQLAQIDINLTKEEYTFLWSENFSTNYGNIIDVIALEKE